MVPGKFLTNATLATVHVVDDDLSHLRSLSRLLKTSGFPVAAYISAVHFLDALHPGMTGCVITDLRMPGMDGRQLQEALRRAQNDLPIIFLTGHGDIPTSVQAMREGAEDFLTKAARKEEILATVRRALEHDRLNRARKAEQQARRAPFETLSGREMEILGHVVRGRLNKQIAADLGIHERTVKFHRTHITDKLGVPSVAELTRMAHEAGLFNR